jgi:peptide/nickel transport system substrate-binding protein
VDLVANVEPQMIPEIEGDPKLSISRTRNARIFLVGMNAFRKPFDDVRVRQAMNYAVDVDAIIKDLWGGHAYRIPTIVGQDWFGYDPDQKPYSYDPDKAKALLAEAGHPNGFEVTFNTPKGRYLLDVETSQAVSGYLAKVGVKANVEVVEYANYIAKLFDANNPANRYTMFYIGYGTPILDIDDVMSGYLDSKRRGLYYNDPQLDDFIVKGLAADTDQDRLAIYKQMLAHVKDVAPWIFLFNAEDIYGLNKRLTGWKARPDEYVVLSKAAVS